jgi:hypothetical protein
VALVGGNDGKDIDNGMAYQQIFIRRIMMPLKKFNTIFCLFLLIGIFLLTNTIFAQYLPWSWPLGSQFPILGQFPPTLWPQQSYFPTAGLSTTSGWPVYSVPPNYTPAPGGVPTSATGCPVGLVTGLTLDEEFGPGTSEITRCLVMRNNIKMLVHIDQFEENPGRPFGLVNIQRSINDYEITNGSRDYKIVSVINGGGGTLVLNQNAATPHPTAVKNIYQPIVEELIAKGVKFYL